MVKNHFFFDPQLAMSARPLSRDRRRVPPAVSNRRLASDSPRADSLAEQWLAASALQVQTSSPHTARLLLGDTVHTAALAAAPSNADLSRLRHQSSLLNSSLGSGSVAGAGPAADASGSSASANSSSSLNNTSRRLVNGSLSSTAATTLAWPAESAAATADWHYRSRSNLSDLAPGKSAQPRAVPRFGLAAEADEPASTRPLAAADHHQQDQKDEQQQASTAAQLTKAFGTEPSGASAAAQRSWGADDVAPPSASLMSAAVGPSPGRLLAQPGFLRQTREHDGLFRLRAEQSVQDTIKPGPSSHTAPEDDVAMNTSEDGITVGAAIWRRSPGRSPQSRRQPAAAAKGDGLFSDDEGEGSNGEAQAEAEQRGREDSRRAPRILRDPAPR